MKKTGLLVLIFSFAQFSFAGEGMWLPQLLKSLNEAEMQGMGMKMTAEDIYSVNKGSLKDAIVHFGGFCTSELISGEGLLLTNHHCGYGQIQSHSSIANNYLKDGFWAPSKKEELPNTGLTATFIVRIEDVSETILAGVGDHMDEKESQSIVDKNIAALQKSYVVPSHQEIKIKPFFNGNQYFLFVTTTYRDVRLVGAPPESIGKFGSDTDNWIWPRHTGDFSLFRIYAGPDNLPADYSAQNIPFKPKHFLPISIDGVEEDDFTLVFGFPGRTNEYLSSYAVSQIVDVLDPAKIDIRDKALKIVDAEMRADEGVKIQYASKFARIANYWKKWIGEVQGLKSSGAVAKKQSFEKEFFKKTKTNPEWNTKYSTLLPQMKKLYTDIEPYAFTRDYYNEIFGRNIEILRVMGVVKKLAGYQEKNDLEGFNNYKKRVDGFLADFYKNYSPAIDQKVFASLMEMYFTKVDQQYISEIAQKELDKSNGDFELLATRFFAGSDVISEDRMTALLSASPQKMLAQLKADPIYRFHSSMADLYQEKVNAPYQELNDKIQKLQRKYMKALMEVFPNKRFYPDANSTMRVTYGQVKGYSPSDSVEYEYMTFLDGVMEKYKPGDYEFDVSPKLRELHRKRDYGQYATEDNKMPVCFIGSNHTTGGNSGSPAIDAHGNLIGLNFDRAWEGTMSDINYDPSICRNIMVDIRYVLFIVDKFAGASHLIEEMKLVHPKKAVSDISPEERERLLQEQRKMLSNPKVGSKGQKGGNKKNKQSIDPDSQDTNFIKMDPDELKKKAKKNSGGGR